MAISRTHTWSAGEVLLASDLNAEFNGILNNASDLVSPFTKAVSMGGFALNFDAANTIALTATTSGISLTGGTLREPTEDALTAHAGGTQAAAQSLSAAKKYHRISVCATAADSVALPAATAGQAHFIRNDGAAAAQVFGTTPDTVNGVATATGVPLPAGIGVWFVCCTAGNWVTPSLSSTTEVLSNKTLTNPAGTTQTLADAATISWDASLGQVGSVTPTANRTFGAPTNLKAGGRYTLSITQDGTGGRTHTFNAVFKCSNGQAFPQPTSAIGAITVYELVSPDGTNLYLNTSSLPAGVILSHGSSSVPAGFLGCDGAAVSRTTYAALFAAVSTTWGVGDGSTTFNVPNFQRRVAVGSGGSGTATLANTVGSTGGEETHTLITAEMPSHTHAVPTHASDILNGGGGGLQTTSGNSGTSGSTGGDGAHNNMQPSAVILMIIKY